MAIASLVLATINTVLLISIGANLGSINSKIATLMTIVLKKDVK